MTTSPLMKNSTPSLSKSFLVVVDKFGSVVKVLDVEPSIPFRAVAGSADKLFHGTALTFFYCSFIE